MKNIAIAIIVTCALLLSACAPAATKATTSTIEPTATTVATTAPTTTAPTEATTATTTAATTVPTTTAAPTTTATTTAAPTTTADPSTPNNPYPDMLDVPLEQMFTVESTAQNVKIIFPPMNDAMFGISKADIEQVAKEEGVTKVIFNQDGSYVFVFNKTAYQAMLKKLKQEVNDLIEMLLEGSDTSMKAITYNSSMTQFTIKVDALKFTDMNPDMHPLIAFFFYPSATMYQMLSGVDPKNIKVVIKLVDYKTGKVLKMFDSTQTDEPW